MRMLPSFPRSFLLLALLIALGHAAQVPQRGRHPAKYLTSILGEGSACVTADFPLEFREEADFNVNEGLGFIKDDSTDLECKCLGKECECFGETDEDCDAYSQIWFYILAYAHQFGAFFYDLPKYEEEYHLQSMLFWSILGFILFWTGFVVIIYQEVKAVAVTRERDERRKLVQARAMIRCPEMRELEEKEQDIMSPRPYITLSGAIVMFMGLFCQLIPFCHLLREMGFQVEFHGFCILFVLMNSFVLSACITLTVMGAVWSCTRGLAALLLLTLALMGDVMLFGGTLWVLVWLAFTAAVMFLYFGYLPGQYKDSKNADDPNNGTYPWWLQDIGDFAVETDMSKIKDAFSKGGKGVVADLTENPVGAKAKELGDSITGKSEVV